MSLFRLMGEKAPTVRTSDLLSEDHPNRDLLSRIRGSAWVRGLAFVVVLGVAMVLYISAIRAISGPIPQGSPHPLIAQLFAAIVAYIVLTFVMEARVPPLEIAPKRSLGLLKGILLGFVLVSLSVAILALMGVYRIESFNPSYNPWYALVGAGLVAGIGEEIMYRGGLFRLVEEGLGTWGATIVSALAFGLIHVTNPEGTLWGGLAISIEAGLLFAAVYALTRSLWWCIGLHMAWNITEGPLWGSIISGNPDTGSWVQSSWTGPEILTGGAFGLEASIVPVILCGALSIALLVYAQRKSLMIPPIWIRKPRKLTTEPAGPAPDPAT